MKIKVTIHMGLPGCEKSGVVEVPDEALKGLSVVRCDEVIRDYADEWAHNNMSCYWEEIT